MNKEKPKFSAQLEMPDLQERRSRQAIYQKSKQDAAFIKKHCDDHKKFLQILSSENKCISSQERIEILSQLATETINRLDSSLNDLSNKELEQIVAKYTSNQTKWPINVISSIQGVLKDQASYVFDELKLGERSMFNVKYLRNARINDSKSSIAKIVVHKMLLNVERYRLQFKNGGGKPPFNEASQLKPLYSGNATEWFNLICRILEQNTDQRNPWELEVAFTKSKTLNEIVKPSAKHTRHMTPAEEKALSSEGRIRDDFRKKLWAAFLQVIHPSIRDGIRGEDVKDPAPPSRSAKKS